jgi:GxxExxY protein
MPALIHKDEVYGIVGAAFEVYNVLGAGFLEAVYQEALEIELTNRGIPFVSQKELRIFYKGQPLRKTYTPDFVAFEKIIVEIKALDHLTTREQAQLLNYLKATGFEVGVLINFGAEAKLEWKRMAKTQKSSHS